MTLVLVLLGLGVVIGTISQRATGMGFALLMAPFFALVFGPKDGVLLMNLGGGFSALIVLAQVWRDVDWKRFGLLIAGALPSGYLGAWVVTRLDSSVLQIILGLLLIAALSVSTMSKKRGEPRLFAPGALLAGGISGFTNATAGIGGPPVAIYAQRSGWAQKNFSATLQPVFAVMSFSAFGAKTLLAGMEPGLTWWIYPGMIVLILVGQWLAQFVTPLVKDSLARTLVIIFCYIGAVSAVVDGVIELVSR